MNDNLVLSINTNENRHILEEKNILPIITESDENFEILHQKIDLFDFNDPPVDPVKLASDLVNTCKEFKGIGLAANQCGLKYRVFVMGTEDEYVAFFNPTIISYSNECSMMEEGCLSFPDLFLKISRPEKIHVKYQDYAGKQKEISFSGITARCFLHEYDHLEGKDFTQVAKPLALKMGKDKRTKLNRRLKSSLSKIQRRKK